MFVTEYLHIIVLFGYICIAKTKTKTKTQLWEILTTLHGSSTATSC